MALMSLAEYLARPKGALTPAEHCACCSVPLQSTITGRRPSDRGTVCDDCYFDLLGDEVEQHPVGRGTVRGCH